MTDPRQAPATPRTTAPTAARNALLERLQTATLGDFEILGELGRGGMATVFLARDLALERKVAIKVLAPELVHGPGMAERFKREARTAANLSHPNIVPIYAIREAEDLLYFVMKLVTGRPLDSILAEVGPAPVPMVRAVLSQVGAALEHAHRQGVIHRDIKPANILIDADGQALVADFGIAKVAEGEGLTQTGAAVGTPTYMSPEQCAGTAAVTAAADQYALGVVAYEMLSGRPPFRGGAVVAALYAHVHEPPPPLSEARPDCPAEVAAAVHRMLAKTPDERFASVEEAVEAIGSYALTRDDATRARLVSLAQTGVVPRLVAQLKTPRSPALRASRVRPRARRTRLLFGIAAAGGVAVLALGTGLWTKRAAASSPLDPFRIATAPFEVYDSTLAIWREGIPDVLTQALDGVGRLRTVPPSVVLRRWTGRGDAATADSLGREVGAGLVVYGRLVPGGPGRVRVTASVYDVVKGRTLADLEFVDSIPRIDRVLDSLTMGVLRGVSASREIGVVRLQSLGTASPEAVRAFLRGERYYRRGAWDSALAQYRAATAEDSAFALAWSRISMTAAWLGDNRTRFTAIPTALRLSRPLAPRESLLVVIDSLSVVLASICGCAGMDIVTPAVMEARGDGTWFRMLDRFMATMEYAIRQYPDDAMFLQRYGVLHLNFGYQTGATIDSALVILERARAADPGFVIPYVNIANAHFFLGDYAAFRRDLRLLFDGPAAGLLREAAQIMLTLLDAPSPDSMRAVVRAVSAPVLNSVLQFRGKGDSTGVELEVVRELGRRAPPDAREFWVYYQAAILATGGRLREMADSVADVPGSLMDLVRASIRGMRIYRKQVPPDEFLAEFDAQTGRTDEPGRRWSEYGAMGLLIELGDTMRLARIARQHAAPPRTKLDSLWSPYIQGVALAYLQLARGDTAAALSGIESLPRWYVNFQWAHERVKRGRLLAALGRPAEAAPFLEWRYYEIPDMVLNNVDFGRIQEQLGNRELALRSYRQLVRRYSGADPEFQDMVTEARQGIARLTRPTGWRRLIAFVRS